MPLCSVFYHYTMNNKTQIQQHVNTTDAKTALQCSPRGDVFQREGGPCVMSVVTASWWNAAGQLLYSPHRHKGFKIQIIGSIVPVSQGF